MKKYGWLIAILGIVTLGMILIFGAAFGAGIAYFFLQAEPAQAAFVTPVEITHEAGVLISAVEDGSAAAEAGLVRGDILLEIDREPVNNLLELQVALTEVSRVIPLN